MANGYCISTSGAERGKSSDTLLFGTIENLGIGKELGGGEFEYVGPAQRSENERLPLATSSLKVLFFLQTFRSMLIGVLVAVVLNCTLTSFLGPDGVSGKVKEQEEEHAPAATGEEEVLNGVGRIPSPD